MRKKFAKVYPKEVLIVDPKQLVEDKYYVDSVFYYQCFGDIPAIEVTLKESFLELVSGLEYLNIAIHLGFEQVDAIVNYDDESAMRAMTLSQKLTEISLDSLLMKRGHLVEDWQLYTFFFNEKLSTENLEWLKGEVIKFFNGYQPKLSVPISGKVKDYDYFEERKCFKFYAYYSNNQDDREWNFKYLEFTRMINKKIEFRSINGFPLTWL